MQSSKIKKSNSKTQSPVLDCLFILAGALFITLLCLWMAGTLLGKSAFQHMPDWLSKSTSSIWGFITAGGMAAVLTKWISRGRPLWQYLVGIFISVLFIAAFVVAIVRLWPQPVDLTQNAVGTVGRVMFRFDFPTAPQEIAFIQKQPQPASVRCMIKQINGFFDEFVDVPDLDKKFDAEINPLARTSILSPDVGKPMAELCFVQKKRHIKQGEYLGIFRCDSTGNFSADKADFGTVELCSSAKRFTGFPFPSFIATAYAATPETTEGWVVPNLHTLEIKKKTGFSVVMLHAHSVSVSDSVAAWYSYAVFVNGTPLYFDGFSPNAILHPFKGTLSDTFGIENLGFCGANEGFENLSIVYSFFTESRREIGKTMVILVYVALREIKLQSVRADNGSEFSSSVNYRRPEYKEYEVFLFSSNIAERAMAWKKAIDARSKMFLKSRIMGVVRPPLPPNDNYGVVLGLLEPNGQIQFTFNARKADSLLTWVKKVSGSDPVFPRSSFLYVLGKK